MSQKLSVPETCSFYLGSFHAEALSDGKQLYRDGYTLWQLSIFQWPVVFTGATFGVSRQRGDRCMLAIGVTVERT